MMMCIYKLVIKLGSVLFLWLEESLIMDKNKL